MANKSMGEIISTLRKEKGMTQKQLADMLNITDKAVSKWERDIAWPDTQTIPKLAEILEVSVEELMNAKSAPTTGHKGAGYLIDIVKIRERSVDLWMHITPVIKSRNYENQKIGLGKILQKSSTYRLLQSASGNEV